MIELKDFIESTLFDIAFGVQKAKVRAKDLAAIAPPSVDGQNTAEVTYVDFDVAIKSGSTEQESSSGAGKLGAKAKIFMVEASADLGGEKARSSDSSTENIHHIKFKVPIHLTADYSNDPNMESKAKVLQDIEALET